ncbi:13128_t:CDS:2 [Acaulospora colombiana]|uniref:13128_t:CDS:1 n=1 Tax=Acaulospora colombiana TaxID=27376 RepID=A0ACA9MVC2_9GLOM|nr:13128_t:CDS:2 [Acaulospora colombiana]
MRRISRLAYPRSTLNYSRILIRKKATMSATCDALVLPVFATEFTEAPTSYKSSVNLSNLWSKTHGKTTKALETRVFHQESGPMLSVVSLGKDAGTPNAVREAGRKAIATGVKAARDSGARSIGIVTGKLEEHDAGELDSFLRQDDHLMASKLWPLIWRSLISHSKQRREILFLLWNVHLPHLKQLRDWAGRLARFMQKVKILQDKGTAEPAKFLEMYACSPTKRAYSHLYQLIPVGVTFDSGGISIKPGANMKAMRGDMGGAATVLATLITIVKLKLPINVVLATPLTENMPGGRATKPAGEAEYDRVWRMPLDEDFGPQIYKSNADLCNTGGRSGGSCTAALFLKAFVEGIEGVDGQKPKLQWAHIDIAGTMEVRQQAFLQISINFDQATRAGPYQKTGMTGRGVRYVLSRFQSIIIYA